MALDAKIVGATTGNGAEVNSSNQVKVVFETNVASNPNNVGAIRTFSEVDDGYVVGTPLLISPEADLDYRLRAATDSMLDNEIFNYTAQNTGKHIYANSTMVAAWATGNFTTNSGNITTTTTGVTFGTYAYFPVIGTATTSYDMELSFTAAPTANTIIDFGGFVRGAGNPYAPTDGAYFRLTSAGLQGVVNYNGTETTTSVFLAVNGGSAWTYTLNKKYQFILYINQRNTEFWIGDGTNTRLYGVIPTPAANGQPCASTALPFSIRHAIVGGAAGVALSAQLGSYSVRLGGPLFSRQLGEYANAAYGSHQGLSGGTMGSLANYANSINPTAAVPTNTTAALGVGLGGQFWETATLAVNTDGIICSYQVPVQSNIASTRRLKITGIALGSYIQTVIAGGPFVSQYSLAFGHNNVSLATSEAASSKAPRRIALPFNQLVTAAQAVSTLVAQQAYVYQFIQPIYVNPGEFVALVTKHVGTVGTSGTIAHTVTFDYSWE
jgi:hypothetical protein